MAGYSHDGATTISTLIADRREDFDRLRLLAGMLGSIAEAVVAMDPAGKIIYWNPAATSTHGWKEDEALGKKRADLVQPGIPARESRAILQRLRGGKPWSGEYKVRHRDGHTFPVVAHDAPSSMRAGIW